MADGERAQPNDSEAHLEMLILSRRDRKREQETLSSFSESFCFGVFCSPQSGIQSISLHFQENSISCSFKFKDPCYFSHSTWSHNASSLIVTVSWEVKREQQEGGKLVKGMEIPFPGRHLHHWGERGRGGMSPALILQETLAAW